jgi:hypothetical protein
LLDHLEDQPRDDRDDHHNHDGYQYEGHAARRVNVVTGKGRAYNGEKDRSLNHHHE